MGSTCSTGFSGTKRELKYGQSFFALQIRHPLLMQRQAEIALKGYPGKKAYLTLRVSVQQINCDFGVLFVWYKMLDVT